MADTTYEQNMRGTAAQAAGCFERKMLEDPKAREEIALAFLTRSLILAKSTAEAQRDSLQSYTAPSTPIGDDADELAQEMSSALIQKKGRDSGGDSRQSILDECIPCLDRTTDALNLSPIDDLLSEFELDLENRWNTLQNIWDLLDSDDIIDDFCQLSDFFSFQCLPDLVAILSLLFWLWKSMLTSFQIDINGALWSLIGLMFGPMLAGLEAIIQQYIDMIMAPIDCIISSLLFQMSKIPQLEADADFLKQRQFEQKQFEDRALAGMVGGSIDQGTVNINAAIDSQLNFAALNATSWEQSRRTYQTPITEELLETVTPETGGEPGSEAEILRQERIEYIEAKEAREKKTATTADWMIDASNQLEHGLGQVGGYLIAGRDRMNSWLESVREDLRAFLFGSGSDFTFAVSYAETLARLARLIAFVKALIKLAQDGIECGSGNSLSEPDMVNFLENYFAPEIGATVTVDENNNVTIVPASSVPVIQGKRGIALESDAAPSRRGVTISVPDCLNRTDATDLRKVEEWIKQISQ